MKRRLRLEGIYDIETVKKVREQGLFDFSLDMRPRSFNFLQGHRLIEMVKTIYQPGVLFSLVFCNEKDFVITKILSDIRETISAMGHSPRAVDFALEFSGTETRQEMDAHNISYYWHYREEMIDEVLHGPLLKGIVFELPFLNELLRKGQLPSFSMELTSKIFSIPSSQRPEFFVRAAWDAELSVALGEYLQFDVLSLTVGPSVESGYRAINTPILVKGLESFHRSLESLIVPGNSSKGTDNAHSDL
jgi:hypothetical protein